MSSRLWGRFISPMDHELLKGNLDMKYQRIILIIGILILGSYFVWSNYFSQEALEKRIEYEQGYKINNQQEIEVEFNFDPSWIPKEDEATNKINRIIYEGYSSVIYLESVTNRSGPYITVEFLIKPTYSYEGGEYLSSYIIEKDPRGFRSLIINCYEKNAQQGYNLSLCSYFGSGPGKLFGIYLNRQLLSSVDHPITIKLGPLNLIKYTKS